jgi:tetratricopeptide (TPR) repeat protein
VDQSKVEIYQNLINKLVNIVDSETQNIVLQENCHLIDRELITIAKENAAKLLIEGNLIASEGLENFADRLDNNLNTWEELNRQTVKLYQENEYEKSLQTAQDALNLAREIWHGDRVEIAKNLSNIALILKAQGKLKEAEPYYRDTLAMRYQIYQGQPRHDLARCFSNLGELLKMQGRIYEAEAYHRDAEAMRKKLTISKS